MENACDFVLQFNFTIAHIPGKRNTAAQFLSRLEGDPKEKIILKIREDIPKKPIEVNIESTVIAQRKRYSLIQQQPTRDHRKRSLET